MDETRISNGVVGRLAPTPSGRMHLGNVWSCLVAWAAARSAGGHIVLRIEDLDPRAQDRRVAEVLMDDLAWLGIDWDGEVVWQSERSEAHAAAIDELARRGLTYPCFCTRSELHAASAPHASDGTYVYAGTCRNLSPDEIAARTLMRPPATRLRVPAEGEVGSLVRVDDLVFGSFEESLPVACGDFLVRRSDGVVAYQLAVVVDDAAAGVSQVVRGRDLLGSVARQSYLQDLLGLPHPTYAHVPLLVAPDGRRLSKREHDLDLGALRQRYADPAPIIGRLAGCIGMAEMGEEVSAAEFGMRFSFAKLKEHCDDIVVDEKFLP